jgi:Zn-dependent protease
MLFAFNNIWKNLFILVSAWVLYGVAGYEFTVITALTCIVCVILKNGQEKET